MNTTKLLKSANSKGKLAKAVVLYQRALSHYGAESNWGVKTSELKQAVGKLLLKQGEEFRLAHPELVDAYQGTSDDDIVWLGDDDPTYAAQVSLGKRKPDAQYFERNKIKSSGNRTETEDTSNAS